MYSPEIFTKPIAKPHPQLSDNPPQPPTSPPEAELPPHALHDQAQPLPATATTSPSEELCNRNREDTTGEDCIRYRATVFSESTPPATPPNVVSLVDHPPPSAAAVRLRNLPTRRPSFFRPPNQVELDIPSWQSKEDPVSRTFGSRQHGVVRPPDAASSSCAATSSRPCPCSWPTRRGSRRCCALGNILARDKDSGRQPSSHYTEILVRRRLCPCLPRQAAQSCRRDRHCRLEACRCPRQGFSARHAHRSRDHEAAQGSPADCHLYRLACLGNAWWGL